MGISATHPSYNASIVKWTRCRDAFDGSDAVKGKGVLYLPKLSKQTIQQYNAYKTRALFYSITSKTISALVGMAMIRQPIVKLPKEMISYFKEDDQVQFYENVSTLMTEDLLLGRVGMLIDRPINGGDPYMCFYTAESIRNWKIENGKLIWLVLSETIEVQDKDDKYEIELETRYRELYLNDAGQYSVQLYNEKEEPIGAATIPGVAGGKAINYIPFWIGNSTGMGFQVDKSPMLDIVDINLSHYRSSADLEHGRHFTALPTPWITGASKGGDLMIGAETAWIIPDAGAKVGFLEFTGQGLQSLEKALSEKQSQLASLSARLLDSGKKGSEAADTVRLRYVSETASLASIVRAVEAIMIVGYREIALWMELDPTEVSIELNKEFLNARMKSSEVIDFITAYIDGGITIDTLIYNLRRGDVIPVEADDEEEKRLVEAAVAKAKAADVKRAQTKTTPPK